MCRNSKQNTVDREGKQAGCTTHCVSAIDFSIVIQKQLDDVKGILRLFGDNCVEKCLTILQPQQCNFSDSTRGLGERFTEGETPLLEAGTLQWLTEFLAFGSPRCCSNSSRWSGRPRSAGMKRG